MDTTRRRLLGILVASIAAAAASGLAAESVHTRRLRPLERRLAPLLQVAIIRSPTFGMLVDRLEGGDVVVYLRSGPLPPRVDGRLQFLGTAAGVRYILVELRTDLDSARAIVILGHELQHAVEVLEQPAIVDRATFEAAYQRIASGRRTFSDGSIGFETRAAVTTGVRIWKELSLGAPVSPALAGTR